MNCEAQGSSCYVAVIPTNLYGKHDNFDLDNAHVVPGLVHKAYLSVMDAKSKGLDCATLIMCGSGSPKRQFVYAPDLACLLIWCLQCYSDEEPVIICPDESEEYKIRDIAEMICRIFSRKFSINMQLDLDISQADGQSRKTATNRKLRGFLPDFKFTSIDQGLEEVIDWFCQAYPNVRRGSI